MLSDQQTDKVVAWIRCYGPHVVGVCLFLVAIGLVVLAYIVLTHWPILAALIVVVLFLRWVYGL